MPEYRRSPDVYQGYNFKKDKQTPVGFILGMKIGKMALAADQACKDPRAPTTDRMVVAVLSGAQWDTGVTDGLYLAGQISLANRQNVATLLYTDLVDIGVTFQYAVYDYDLVAKQYFLAFHSNNVDMKGLIEKRGEDLNLSVADDVSTEVQSPENYAFMIGIKPRCDEAQTLHIATSSTNNIVKAWGLKVG
jgi:hypothetical protein